MDKFVHAIRLPDDVPTDGLPQLKASPELGVANVGDLIHYTSLNKTFMVHKRTWIVDGDITTLLIQLVHTKEELAAAHWR